MTADNEGITLEMSPALKRAVRELIEGGMDLTAAVRRLAWTNPELFTTPADEVAKLMATWD